MVKNRKFTVYFNKHKVQTIEEEWEDLHTGFENTGFPPVTSKFISKYIEDVLHFTSYYWNCYMIDGNTLHIDYGSHTNFINIVQEDEEK